MNHRTLPEFWHHYLQIPKDIQELADKNFALLKANPDTPHYILKRLAIYGLYAWGYTIAPWRSPIHRTTLYGFGSATTTSTTTLLTNSKDVHHDLHGGPVLLLR